MTPSEQVLTKLLNKKTAVKKTILYHKLGQLGPQQPYYGPPQHGHSHYAPVFPGHSHHYSELPPPYLDYDPTLVLNPHGHSPHYPGSGSFPHQSYHSVPPSFSPANEYSPYFYAPTHGSYRNNNFTDKSFITRTGRDNVLFNENNNSAPRAPQNAPQSAVVFPNSRSKRNAINPNELLQSVSYLLPLFISLLKSLVIRVNVNFSNVPNPVLYLIS